MNILTLMMMIASAVWFYNAFHDSSKNPSMTALVLGNMWLIGMIIVSNMDG